MKTVFGELSLVMTSTTSTKTTPRKEPNRTNKGDCKDAKVCALYDDTIKILAREPLLIERLSII